MKQAGVTADQTAYIGDDSVDLPALQPVAFLCCGRLCTLCAKCRGLCTCPWRWQRAFREMSDMILHAQGKDEVYTSAKGF